MVNKFIERPVLSTVISILIVILGILGMVSLPITQYPDIAPPTVKVQANFPGADAETVLKSVVTPIEEEINGVEGMTYMTSTSSNSGRGEITVYFEHEYDADIAAVNVQNRVALANPVLPQEVVQAGVQTRKQQTSALMFTSFYSSNPEYGGEFIANYLNINVVPELQRVEGVGDVNVFSSKEYAMRVWMKPDKMAHYGLEPSDIQNAINSQSQEAAAGNLGENHGETFTYNIQYPGRFEKAGQYENIVLKAIGDGKYLRLEDVADVELGSQNYGVYSETKGYPSVSMAIYQTKGSNAQDIIEEIYDHLDQYKEEMPEGMDIFIPYDTNEFLNASIDKVLHTLFEAFILVFIVVFIFLQDIRSTLIPAIAVPVSIIGAFFFLNLFGFSINLLTLFAMILAIGIVVDDAIVVVEAVHAKLDEGEQDVQKATKSAMSEITGAIISITLVMASVFVPVTFITGPTGVFYQQFGITLMTSIAISAINALSLSPALCALFLKPKSEEGTEKKKNMMQRFHSGFNRGFNATVNKYVDSLGFLYKHKWIVPVVLILTGFGIWWASSNISSGFVPNEDRNMVFANVELPPGSSMDKTVSVEHELREKAQQIPGVEDASLVAGFSMLSGQGNNYGLGFIRLDDIEERQDPEQSIQAITEKLFGAGASIPGAEIVFFEPPSIPGYGASAGFEANLQDKSGGSFDKLDEQNKKFLMKLNQRPEIQYAQSSFSAGYPQYELDINVPIALEKGVSINTIFGTLQGYIGGIYTADFSRFGKQYRVYIQALPEDRVNKGQLDQMQVKTKDGEMTPITEFIDLKRIYGPQSATRFNLFNSSEITGAPAEDYSTGDAITAVNETVDELPKDFDVAYSGLTREEIKSGSQTLIIFILVVVFVYFLLAAQYESYLLPLSVLLSLPFGIFGAYFTTWLAGMENNIYFQISLVMLIGLLAKNAILIVEFAIQRRQYGMSIVEAAFEGARVRLRPILMTSFAFIFGLMPLALASGVGAVGNRSIGMGTVGGMLIGTFLGVFVIPLLYIFFEWLQEKISGEPEFITEDGDNNQIESTTNSEDN